MGTDLWGSGGDEGHSVQTTTDGGYIIIGNTQIGNGEADVWLIKTDANGSEEWNQTYGGDDWDGGFAVFQIDNGGYVILAYTRSFGNGEGDVWLIKTDESGNEEWNQTFGGSSSDQCRSFQETDDGGFILAGVTYSFGNGDADAWLIKTDSLGVEEWNQTYGGIERDESHSIQKTSDGGFIMTGSTWSYGNGDGQSDVWLIKTDESGNEEWNQTFGGDSYEQGYSVQQTFDDGYIFTGITLFSSSSTDSP